MKKCILIVTALLTCSTSYANPPEKVEELASKITLKNGNGYYVLADGSCYKVIAFSKRWRTLKEWWNGASVIPKNYECLPEDWFVGTEIEVYPKSGNLDVNENDAANKGDLSRCSHLLYNSRTGQVMFAMPLSIQMCMGLLFQDARNEGYKQGYKDGYADGYDDGDFSS